MVLCTESHRTKTVIWLLTRQTSLELVEDGKTLSEARECDAHDRNLGAFCEDAEEASHEHV